MRRDIVFFPAVSRAMYTPDAAGMPRSSRPFHTAECTPTVMNPPARSRTFRPATFYTERFTFPGAASENSMVVEGLNGSG